MKQYTIEIDDTISEFLDYISKSNNLPIEKIISDLIFNRVNIISENINKEFLIIEDI